MTFREFYAKPKIERVLLFELAKMYIKNALSTLACQEGAEKNNL